MIAYQRQNYPAAIDYFVDTNAAGRASQPVDFGAQYNLARTYEAAGDIARAIFLYQHGAPSPDRYGELLRAKWL